MKKTKKIIRSDYDSLWDTFDKAREAWTPEEEAIFIAWDEDLRRKLYQKYLETLVLLYQHIDDQMPPTSVVMEHITLALKYKEILEALGEVF